MKNITVSVSEDTHRRARMRAAELHTSVSAVVRDFLITFSGQETDYERRKRLERSTIESIRRFDATDRLPRDRVHDRRHPGDAAMRDDSLPGCATKENTVELLQAALATTVVADQHLVLNGLRIETKSWLILI